MQTRRTISGEASKIQSQTTGTEQSPQATAPEATNGAATLRAAIIKEIDAAIEDAESETEKARLLALRLFVRTCGASSPSMDADGDVSRPVPKMEWSVLCGLESEVQAASALLDVLSDRVAELEEANKRDGCGTIACGYLVLAQRSRLELHNSFESLARELQRVSKMSRIAIKKGAQ